MTTNTNTSTDTTAPINTPEPAQPRGVAIVTIGGALRTLKFGVNTTVAFGRLYAEASLDFATQFGQIPVQALRDMTYCALQARAKDNNLPDDFSSETVGDWIDEMPQTDWDRVRTTLLASLAMGKPEPVNTAKSKA